MRKIVVPFDRSQYALRALQHAIALVRDLGQGEVHVVHVHESAVDYGRAAAYQSADKIEKGLDKASAEILKPADELLTKAGIAHRTAVLTGSPAEQVSHYVDENGGTEIVMGSRGAGAVGNLLLGSVATKVIHHAHVPVTVVK